MEKKKQQTGGINWDITGTWAAAESKVPHSKFWLGELSVNKCKRIVGDIVLFKHAGEYLGNIRDITCEWVLKDNLVYATINYQNNGKKVIKCNFDEFGGIARGNGTARNYTSDASACIRGVMSERFGTEYDNALIEKFGENAVALD